MAACILLAAQLFVPLLAAQGIRRTADSHPGLGRRIVGNCTAADSNCNFCAAAFLVTWSLREVGGNVKTVTLQEVVNEDGSVDLETITAGWNSDDAAAWTSSLELGTQGPHTSLVENLGFVMTYPTSYVVFQDSYIWQGTLFTDNTCAISTDAPAEVKGPTPTVQALPGGTFSALEGTITDKAGYHFDLALADSLFDANLGANFNDGAFKLCNAGCDGFVGFTTPATPVTPAGPPQLTVAFATACQRSTKGVDGVVKLGDGDCTAVKAPSPASPSGGGSGGGSGGSGGSAGSGSQSGGGGGGSGGGGETRVTTTDSKGSTVIMNVGGGGGETRVTTTDSKGSTVIMNVGGGNLYTSVNVQGQTVVGTGAANAGPMGGQITLTNSDGATIVVQGGSLASPGAGNGGGITVTDVRGSLMVVQGGETGTLSAMPGGGTALIAATLTQTSWVAGDTISAGAAASSSTEPGVQSEAGTARLPSLLGMSALLLSTMLMGVMIL